MKKLSIIFLLAGGCFAAAPACTPGTFVGVTFACNIPYDSTVPSRQTYARTIAYVAYPAGGAANASNDCAVIAAGKGWVEQNNLYSVQHTLAAAIVNAKGWAVYSIYTTWASAAQVVASHSIGDTLLTIEPINNSAGNLWWPNLSAGTCTVDGCQGYSVPFQVIYGSQAAGDQETITVTAQGGSGLIQTVSALTKNHAANEMIYLPKTQAPAAVADYSSFFNWLGANAGQGTYPCNPKRIHVIAISSDAHGSLMAVLSRHDLCLVSCGPDLVSWWGSSVGNDGGSSNTASAWDVVSVRDIGVPVDLNYMWSNSSSASGGNTTGPVQSVLVALIGCIPGVETGCMAALAAASPKALLPATSFRGSIAFASGGDDFTTPPCPYQATWGTNAGAPAFTANQAPCPGNMYNASGVPYSVWMGSGIGHGADLNAKQDSTGEAWPWVMTGSAGGASASAAAAGGASHQ